MMARRLMMGGNQRLLAAYPGAAAAYSLRDLTGTNPDVVLVSRSIDDAELAFNATEINNGTLANWCGAGDGFVKTWYDQSGNGNDATQDQDFDQSVLVSAGVLVTENGRPALTTQTLSSRSGFNISFFLDISSASSFVVLNPTTQFDANALVGLGLGTSLTDQRWYAPLIDIINTKIGLGFGPEANIFREPRFDKQYLISLLSGGGSQKGFHDGVEVFTGSYASSGDSAKSITVTQAMQEIVVYPSSQFANRVAIESIINNYYGIY